MWPKKKESEKFIIREHHTMYGLLGIRAKKIRLVREIN
jgi:hypothetical protein